MHDVSEYTCKWQVVHDPEGTFGAGNHMGYLDIISGLKLRIFAAGTRLEQRLDRGEIRVWQVAEHANEHDNWIQDAWTYNQTMDGVIWLRKDEL